MLQSCKGAKKLDNHPNRIEWNGIRVSAQFSIEAIFNTHVSVSYYLIER